MKFTPPTTTPPPITIKTLIGIYQIKLIQLLQNLFLGISFL